MNQKKLTWPELRALAIKHYNAGGDGVVECWCESDYDDWGHMTEAEALEMFGVRDAVICDMTADAECYRIEAAALEPENERSDEWSDDWTWCQGDDWRPGDAPWDAPGMSVADFI